MRASLISVFLRVARCEPRLLNSAALMVTTEFWKDGYSSSEYAALLEANTRYEEFLILQTPEAYPNLVEAYHRYLDRPCQKKSTGSAERIETGSGLAATSQAAPGALGNSLNYQYSRLEDLLQTCKALLETPQRQYRERRPADVQNPVGELLGNRDDDRGSVKPHDEYKRDGFVVSDDDGEEDEEGSDSEADYGTANPTFDDEVQDQDEDNDSESNANGDVDGSGLQTDLLLPPRANAGASQSSDSDSDSDDDMPLDALRDKTRAKHVSEKRKEKRKAEAMSSPDLRSSHGNLGEGTDITAQPPQQKRLKRTKGHRHLFHRSAQNDSLSDAEPLAPASHLDGPEIPHHHQLVSSQESVASSSTVDESPRTPHMSPQIQGESSQNDEDELSGYDINHANTPSHLGGLHRTTRRLPDSDSEMSS
ncbi:hypothetical protein DFH29DRAFT_1078257 [Suillus ampliporus]|nr:hypothetical protein DFH29DRAFT_1078257 [Suillus ampliporus]